MASASASGMKYPINVGAYHFTNETATSISTSFAQKCCTCGSPILSINPLALSLINVIGEMKKVCNWYRHAPILLMKKTKRGSWKMASMKKAITWKRRQLNLLIGTLNCQGKGTNKITICDVYNTLQ